MVEQEERLEDEPEEELDEDDPAEAPGSAGQAGFRDGWRGAGRWEHLSLRVLTPAERELVQRVVRRFWRQWGGAFRARSVEDLEVEAVLVVLQKRAAAAVLTAADGEKLLTKCIRRRLRKCAAREYRERGRPAARPAGEIDAGLTRELGDAGPSSDPAPAGRPLLELVEDETTLAALRALAPLDRRIADLWIIDDLADQQIAARLNAEAHADAAAPGGKERHDLTAEAVRGRRKRAKAHLRALAGREAGAAAGSDDGARPAKKIRRFDRFCTPRRNRDSL